MDTQAKVTSTFSPATRANYICFAAVQLVMFCSVRISRVIADKIWTIKPIPNISKKNKQTFMGRHSNHNETKFLGVVNRHFYDTIGNMFEQYLVENVIVDTRGNSI